MSRFFLLLVVVLLCLFSLAVSQPDMPDMPGMGDDMFEVDGFEAYDEPVFASSKKAAPIVTKKAPPMRRIDYTYEGHSTSLPLRLLRSVAPHLRLTLPLSSPLPQCR